MSARHAVAVVVDDAAIERTQRAGADAWWRYLDEVLGHLRLPFRTLTPGEAATPPDDVAVLVHATTPSSELDSDAVEDWVRAGGALVVVGDPGPLASVAGAAAAGSVDDGHVTIDESPVWSSRPTVPLHAIGGVRLATTEDVEVLARWDQTESGDTHPAVTLRQLGTGLALTVGVDVWQSIVRIQQGYPVVADGKPAADGTAPIDDGILKCEDGMAVSFERDRAMPPGEPELAVPFDHSYPPPSAVPMFDQPHADLWRSAFLQCLWWAAEQTDAVVPWLGYWPAGISAVAHMSHDSDGNVDDHGRAALDSFAAANVKVTWCHVFPGGYSPSVLAAITEAGHENALHYNAMGDADLAEWGWPQIRAQYAWAQAVTGTERIVSNKNHYTRWENWTEFYTWCERLGIEIDESRGPSKQGSVGFIFGTAHLSFPIADASEDNRFLDVLNLPLHTQDLAWAGHESIRDVILDGAEAVHGVAHFLFHGPHLHLRPPTRAACVAVANEARRRGMPWWTSAQLNTWERSRRGVTLSVEEHDDGWTIHAHATEPVAGASVLLPANSKVDGQVVTRHGRQFVELAVDLVAGDNSWRVTR
ncbi:hypothetical protein FB561_5861 [Kribbella amoyensis]|uniref:Uncharacterized protein n=1 Tax=Kribbella amoyensis TaxID=996641 RepID=A0A561C0U3_9ACTN|nr:hypothetical protein [Kribbella amoyensis]TWD84667.1 hypothetical protein FB561_5861 [Kribbella amoyensis]